MNECLGEIAVFEKSGCPLIKRISETLVAAEALGVRFDFSLEDLERSIGFYRVLIAKLLVESPGLGL